MRVIEISADKDLSYYINASEIEVVEISESTEKKSDKEYFFQAVLFLKSGKIIFDNELFPDKKEIYKKYFVGVHYIIPENTIIIKDGERNG